MKSVVFSYETKTALSSNVPSIAGHARTVAFAVNGRGGGSFQVKDYKLVLRTVMINDGNGYDKDTGVFTAPRAGTYLLSANIMGSPEGGIIGMNGEVRQKVYSFRVPWQKKIKSCFYKVPRYSKSFTADQHSIFLRFRSADLRLI